MLILFRKKTVFTAGENANLLATVFPCGHTVGTTTFFVNIEKAYWVVTVLILTLSFPTNLLE